MTTLSPSQLCRFRLLAAAAVLLLPGATSLRSQTREAAPFTLEDGDRVVFLGNTYVERLQHHGHLETLLTRRFPERHVTFRNLGWSGDNVFGHSRAGFDPIETGFRFLRRHVEEARPTVVIVGYGMNESFWGEEGMPRFRDGLEKLHAMLEETGARVAYVGPIPHERLAPPLPDPTAHNEALARTSDVLRGFAAERGAPFVDLFAALRPFVERRGVEITDNGIHLTEYGYWRAALEVEKALGAAPEPWRIDVTLGASLRAQGAKVLAAQLDAASDARTVLTLRLRDAVLPEPATPAGGPAAGPRRRFRVRGLREGTYTLSIDGAPVATADAATLGKGLNLESGPELVQVEALREVIRRKNFLHFNRWRPHNTTYLFGFRKHEQGQNAVEIPAFDPLIEDVEKEIAALRVPREHTYELVREGRAKQ